MEFRPCIDIHNGKVKQIVGGTLKDAGDYARENFVSGQAAADYARLYRENGLRGGHIILLNGKNSEYYKEDVRQAREALEAWPGALQIGGGITVENAAEFIRWGASHVIVTSYVFAGGEIRFERLEKLVQEVGRSHLVLDVSCRKKDGIYYVVTDRWQKFTSQPVEADLLERLGAYCDEFLVHAVNVEGTGTGVDKELLQILSKENHVPVTYAGGIGTMEDIHQIEELGGGRIHFTVGSALDLFGGSLSFEEIVKKYCEKLQK
ncbi:MAG: phosphoribosylformimino-5-aminoimidazole carboxamide ribotide isomerase [Lachnospiraceae bacterium]|nr:phosphoribosylformimino-5-aminoimidazole carboxamide ribotide isomerase [Lachnospiraceae bacterium]